MIAEVKEYILSNISDNEIFKKADEEKQSRTIKEAEAQIKMHYGKIDIPVEALSYQTIWILSSDDTTHKGQQGIGSLSVNGISVSIRSPRPILSPYVLRILGRKKGRYVL